MIPAALITAIITLAALLACLYLDRTGRGGDLRDYGDD